MFHDQVMQHYLKSIPCIGSLWRIIANKVLFVLCMIVYRVILLKRIIMTTDDAITICEGIVIVDFKIRLVKGVITVKVKVIVNLRWLVIRSYREQRIWWSRAFFYLSNSEETHAVDKSECVSWIHHCFYKTIVHKWYIVLCFWMTLLFNEKDSMILIQWIFLTKYMWYNKIL